MDLEDNWSLYVKKKKKLFKQHTSFVIENEEALLNLLANIDEGMEEYSIDFFALSILNEFPLFLLGPGIPN